MINKIKCFIGSHVYSSRKYDSPLMWPSGFFSHFGIISECICCGKVASAESMDLPIIEPRFN